MTAFVVKVMCDSGAHIDYGQGPVFMWLCWYSVFTKSPYILGGAHKSPSMNGFFYFESGDDNA